jgi:predicted transcriptional regulator
MKKEETNRTMEWSSDRIDCDVDWKLNHMLTDEKPVMIKELIERSGWDRGVVEASLSRLENNCMITVTENSASLLSLSEMLILNNMIHTPNTPIYIENGVIKAKKQC